MCLWLIYRLVTLDFTVNIAHKRQHYLAPGVYKQLLEASPIHHKLPSIEDTNPLKARQNTAVKLKGRDYYT